MYQAQVTSWKQKAGWKKPLLMEYRLNGRVLEKD